MGTNALRLRERFGLVSHSYIAVRHASSRWRESSAEHARAAQGRERAAMRRCKPLLSLRMQAALHADSGSTWLWCSPRSVIFSSRLYGGDLASTGTVKPLLRAQVLSPGKTLGKNHNCQHWTGTRSV